MSYPWMPIVVNRAAVMHAAKMSHRIALLDNMKEPIKVLDGLSLHKIVFIGHRPPDVSVSREPRNHIAQVSIISLGRHSRKAPVVVRMKKNQVGFNSQLSQIDDALFKM